MIAELIIGILSGTLAGLFGIGGAVISTPLLRIFLEVPGHIALGTPLPVVIVTALSALFVYTKKNYVLYKQALIIGITGSFAAVVGAASTSFFSGSVMMFFTSLFILLIALKLTFPIRIPKAESFETKTLIPIGIIAGFVSGFLGIGGGAILVPLLLLIGLPMHMAIGTSLLSILIFAIPGSIEHYLLGNVSVPLLLPLAIGVILGAQIGSRSAVKVKSESLGKVFIGFLLLLALWLMLFELVKL